MPGYWDLAAQYPGIVQNAGANIANAIAQNAERRQRGALAEMAKKQEQDRIALEQEKIQAEQTQDTAKANALAADAEAKRRANVQRHLIAAAQRGVPVETLRAAAQRYNVELADPEIMAAESAAVLGYQEPPKPEKGPLPMSDIGRVVLDAGYVYGTKEFAEEVKRREIEARADARRRGQNITINNDLTPSAKTKVQGEVMNADQRLRQLDQIGAEIDAAGGHDEVSSIIETGRATVGGAASRLWSGALSQEDRDKYGARAGAIAAMANFSNDIIKDLSGAAVNAHEWVRLRRSVPLPEDPGYVREEKMRIWRDNYAMIREAGYTNLQEGIKAMQSQLKSYSPGRKSEAATAPQETGSRDQEEIYNTLVEQGVDENEAYRRAVEGE